MLFRNDADKLVNTNSIGVEESRLQIKSDYSHVEPIFVREEKLLRRKNKESWRDETSCKKSFVCQNSTFLKLRTAPLHHGRFCR